MIIQSNRSIVIEKFWENIPSAWKQVRLQIRHISIEEYQITEEQFQVLRRIRKGNSSVSALAKVSQTSRSAVSKAVEILVRRGFVVRSKDPSDRRNIPLSLSEEGQRAMDKIFLEVETWLMGHLELLNQEEINTLKQGLDILHKIFSTQ